MASCTESSLRSATSADSQTDLLSPMSSLWPRLMEQRFSTWRATTEGRTVSVGNRRLLEDAEISLEAAEAMLDPLAQQGKTPMLVGVDGHLAGVVAVADTLKPTSAAAIRSLRDMGIEVAMLTGDNRITAAAIAREVGVDRVLAEVLPEDKAAEVARLQADGRAGGGWASMMRQRWPRPTWG